MKRSIKLIEQFLAAEAARRPTAEAALPAVRAVTARAGTTTPWTQLTE
ncbi:MAG TPA: hypothetical protein VFA63_13470 [Pseudonocardiaceae bacterium]|nr:hypothetical protein [Pseudonocardiaceae bacterium]